jgi:tellurite resistance protein
MDCAAECSSVFWVGVGGATGVTYLFQGIVVVCDLVGRYTGKTQSLELLRLEETQK